MVSNMEDYIKGARYIVFLIDCEFKDHDGKVFTSLVRAREFANNIIREEYADKAVIGMFVIDLQEQEMLISTIETIGFKGDKKSLNQLKLFDW